MTAVELKAINDANTLVKDKLSRRVTYIRAQINLVYSSPYRKGQDKQIQAYQHAIRIFESRKRMIDREFLAAYGPDDQMTAMAKLELSLTRQDDGTLFKVGTYQHQQGRLFCKACDTDDDGNGNPILLARLCPACHKGIQHVYTSLKEADAVGLGGNDANSATFVRVFVCEGCSHTDKYAIAKVPLINQDKPANRPATTIMLNTGK